MSVNYTVQEQNPKPVWLDTGDNAWQLTAATLVGLQSVPGLMILYAGSVKSKWAINSAFMAFYAFASVLICWVIWAYKIGFGVPMIHGLAGRPGPALSMEYQLTQALLPTSGISADFPMSTMVYFQFVFAAITLILSAGALLGRMNFLAWIIYVPLWLTFSYCVGAYSLWGGGFLASLGCLDYSGGYVIHVSSGTAGWVAAYWVGPRLDADRQDNRPSNIGNVLIGAGLLWLGWNGFNGGDPYAASTDAGVAVLNTNVCTAMSMLSWTLCDCLYYGKPSVIGAVNGMITGLVAITPAAGFIAGWSAIAIGFGSGVVPWASMNIFGKKVAFMRRIDDVLGVFHTHMVAGTLGGCATGIFATTSGVVSFGDSTFVGGAIEGNGKQVGYQIAGALFIMAWNVVWTSLICCFIQYVLRIPLRMSEEALLIGDYHCHGEEAYVFGEGTSA
ncbi:ammonium transporter, Amt family, partial [Lecanoromycetidae sp. Uapishka_2]